jgi:LysM repeat protein
MKPTLFFITVSMVFASPILLAKSVPSSASESEHSNASYTVKKGDSIARIAHRNQVSTDELMKINGLAKDSIIKPGQILKIPAKALVKKTNKPDSSAKPSTAKETKNTSDKTYTVRKNDTFSSISKREKVPVSDLLAANPDVKPTALHQGQVLNLGAKKIAHTKKAVPSTAPEKKSTPAPEKRSALPKSPVSKANSMPPREVQIPEKKEETSISSNTAIKKAAEPQKTESAKAEPANAAGDKKIRPITIESEITYGEFAAQHGTDTERLNALNGLDLNKTTVLAKGSELYVPNQP